MFAGRCRTRWNMTGFTIIDVNDPFLDRATIGWPAGADDWLRRTGRAVNGAETTGDFVVRRCRQHVGDRRQATIDERNGGKKARRSLDDRRLDYNNIKCYTYRCHFGLNDYNRLYNGSGMYSIWAGGLDFGQGGWTNLRITDGVMDVAKDKGANSRLSVCVKGLFMEDDDCRRLVCPPSFPAIPPSTRRPFPLPAFPTAHPYHAYPQLLHPCPLSKNDYSSHPITTPPPPITLSSHFHQLSPAHTYIPASVRAHPSPLITNPQPSQ